MKCSQCGGTEFEEDRARADVICLNCGFVAGENAISAEMEFVETSNGVSAAVGRFVSDESQMPGFRASRQVTESNAKRRIETICGQLRLGQDVITSAFRFYQTALFRGLTRGRLSNQISAACVYLAARQLRVNLMLLDLSDIVSVNVYALGHAFQQLKRRLNLSIPEVDPCILIERFASQLEFGEKTVNVATTAMRLLQRMKKDWISVGRRPSGLAAAALLVSSRIHEFNRTEEDVARVARISQNTTKKRLQEFGKTASSALSIDAFLTVDYDEEEDPPAYTKAQQHEKKKAKQDKADSLDDASMDKARQQIRELGRRIDDELIRLAEKRCKIKGIGQATTSKGVDYLLGSTSTADASNKPGTSKSPEKVSRDVLRSVLDGVVDPMLLESCTDDLHIVTACSGEKLCDLVNSVQQIRDYHDEMDENTVRDCESVGGESLKSGGEVKPMPKLSESILTASCVEEVKPMVGLPADAQLDLKLPAFLPSAQDVNADSLPELTENDVLKTDDIDDDEIVNEYILKPVEVMVKATYWFKENGEFMEARRKKQAEKRRMQAEGRPKPKRRNKQLTHATGDLKAELYTAESIKKERTLSRKINYEALEGLVSNNAQPEPIDNPQDPKEPGPLLAATLSNSVEPIKKVEKVMSKPPDAYAHDELEVNLSDDDHDVGLEHSQFDHDDDWQTNNDLW